MPSSAPLPHATFLLREVLLAFVSRPLTLKEWRRATTVSNCDFRALTFFTLFDDAIEAGFIAETEHGRFELTSAGKHFAADYESLSHEISSESSAEPGTFMTSTMITSRKYSCGTLFGIGINTAVHDVQPLPCP